MTNKWLCTSRLLLHLGALTTPLNTEEKGYRCVLLHLNPISLSFCILHFGFLSYCCWLLSYVCVNGSFSPFLGLFLMPVSLRNVMFWYVIAQLAEMGVAAIASWFWGSLCWVIHPGPGAVVLGEDIAWNMSNGWGANVERLCEHKDRF